MALVGVCTLLLVTGVVCGGGNAIIIFCATLGFLGRATKVKLLLTTLKYYIKFCGILWKINPCSAVSVKVDDSRIPHCHIVFPGKFNSLRFGLVVNNFTLK